MLFKTIHKIYDSEDEKLLHSQIGIIIDIRNIVRIIRLKKYFPTVNIYEYILPFGKKIKNKVIDDLVYAKDIMETIKKISGFYYSKLKNLQSDQLYDYEDELIYEVNKSIMSRGEPSPSIPLAYLSLKTVEIHNLIRIIEGIRYSIPVKEIKMRLTGINDIEIKS